MVLCVGTNPAKTDHIQRVRQQAGAGSARATNKTALMARLKSGDFESLVEYHNLGVASAVVIQGKLLSFGVLGEVWAVELERLTHRHNREEVGYQRPSDLVQ